MKQPLVYIVILNWNGFCDTTELIKSLFNSTYSNFKIIVIDNNSANDEAGKLKIQFSNEIEIISLSENLGFSGGNNVGIKYALEANADYVLLLNNDTTVEPNFLDKLIEIFEQYKGVGISAPQINYYYDPKRIWSAGGKINKIRSSGFAVSNKTETELYRSDRLVDFVSGCCMLIENEVFRNVGMFDENFFLYTEDTDFCYRVKKAGYKILVTSESKIFHKVHRSTKTIFTSLPLYYTTRNRLFFSRKNFKKFFPLTLIYIITTMFIKSIYWLLKGEIANISAVFSAFKDFLSGNMGKTDHVFFIK